MYLLLVFVVVLLVFSMWQSRRKRAQAQSLHQAITPGVRVMTSSGIYGLVIEVESDTIVIEISEGVDVRFAKQAVMRVVPHLDEAAADTDGLDGAADTDGTGDTSDTDRPADRDVALDPAEQPAREPVQASKAGGHEKGSDAVPTT